MIGNIFFEAVTEKKISFFRTEFVNTELYSYSISFSFLCVAILSPLLSGVADYSGSKKSFLKFFCYLGAIATSCLYFFSSEHLEISMLFVVLASIGFWASLVFYNAYLPEIADRKFHDKISAKGFALGYIGSSILLILLLVAIQGFGMPARWSFPIVGVWWAGFAHITYAKLPNNVYDRKPEREKMFSKGFQELKNVWLEMKNQTRLKRFLISFFIYSMGVQTVMTMATFFGAQEIQDMPDAGLIISVLIIQFIAVGGSYLFSFLSKKFGNIKALVVAVIIWIGICVAAYFTYFAIQFYALAAVVGLVMGGIQALSRSTYSKMLPYTQDHASYFSFYDVMEKIGVVIGTFAFGYIVGFTGSMRNSVFVLLLFFIIGLILLFTIPKEDKHVGRNI